MKLSREAVLVTSLLLTCLPQIHCTLGRGLSTPEERARARNIARSLEQDPLSEDAPANRQWLLDWMIEVPDIRFESCVDLLRPDVRNQYRYSSEVNQQITFSAASFRLEHPDHLRDDSGAYIAGVEGALRAYESLLKSTPDAKLPFLDELLAKRDRGELADYVATLANERCKRPNTALILNSAGAGVGLVLSLLFSRWFGRRVPPLSRPASGKSGLASARSATIARRVVLVCTVYSVIVLAILHILEPEFDPRFRFMSEYALGDYGWLMTSTFLALGSAPFVAAVGLREVHQSSPSTRIGLGLLLVAGIFIWLAGIFKDSIPHLLASVVVFPTIVMAVLLLSWTFRRAAGWHNIYRVTLLIAIGMLAAFWSMTADVGMPGLQQRAFIVLFLLWLAIVVHRSVRLIGAA